MSTALETKSLTATEVGQQGRAIYFAEIQDKVEPAFNGKYLTLDIISHDWEIGEKHRETLYILRARHPQGEFYTLKVGEIVIGHAGSAG
jgi:hypothetical protein